MSSNKFVSAATIGADYDLAPEDLSGTLEWLLNAEQPAFLWGPPGVGKSDVAKSMAKTLGMQYIDVRALLLDPVDLRGIPYLDEDKRTRWGTPVFLPKEDATDRFLINLEELPAAPPMVQVALYSLVLDRMVGEYTLPPGAQIIGCGNRQNDRGAFHEMSSALASRFVHIDVKVDVDGWLRWAGNNDISPEIMFFIKFRPELLHDFDPRNKERAFPCPRTWAFMDNLFRTAHGNCSSEVEMAIYRGTVGEAAAVEFSSFLRVCKELEHPQAIIDDPDNARIPEGSVLLATCGSLYRMADGYNFSAIMTYAKRLRPELGEFLVGACVRQNSELQRTRAYIGWAASKGGQR